MNKILLASALTTSLIMAGCSSSSDTAQDIVDNSTVKVSGSITDSSASPEVPLSGVTVAAKYGNASLNPDPVTTDASGNYSTTVLKGTDFYLSASKTDYITLNSAIKNLSADDTGNDVGLVLTTDAENMLTAAFGAPTSMTDAAWLVIDVVDANGNTVTTLPTITPSPGPNEIGGPVPDAPAYIAKYSNPGSVTVTVNGVSQTGTLVNGEVLFMEFEQ